MELLVNSADIVAHRMDAHVQMISDLFIGETFGEPTQDFLLAVREFSRNGSLRCSGPEGLDNFESDGSGHWSATGHHLANGIAQLRRRQTFEEIAGRSGGQGAEYFFRVFEY